MPFYQYVVCTDIDVGLIVETWGNGGQGLEAPDWNFGNGKLPVISSLKLDFKIDGFAYSYTKDHS